MNKVRHNVKNIKLLLAGSVANMFEWYDYALFGHLAGVMGTKFFPDSAGDTISLLEVFFVFAVGYIMRPLGGVVFGIIGDKLGRKMALSSSVICMSFPTIMMGLLPTYSAIGAASTIVMILARMLQGLSMGGALVGSITFNIEHTTKKHHGFVGSLSMAGICAGILLGSIVVASIKSVLSAEQFLSWGWRVPFLLGFFIFWMGLYIKRHVAETPVFECARDTGVLEASPLVYTLRHHSIDMLMSIFINSTGSVIFYMGAVFTLSFLKIRGLYDAGSSWLLSGCYIMMTLITLASGWLSDVIGRRRFFYITISLTMLATPIIVNTLQNGPLASIIVVQIILSFLAAMYIGPEPALQSEFYPANVRSTALSLSYNLATSIFGGTTPYAMMLILHKTGNLSYCIWYIEFCAVLSLIGLICYKDRSQLIH